MTGQPYHPMLQVTSRLTQQWSLIGWHLAEAARVEPVDPGSAVEHRGRARELIALAEVDAAALVAMEGVGWWTGQHLTVAATADAA